MYQNATIRGTELRRNQIAFYRADGTLLRELMYWEKRTIDEVRNGIEWTVPAAIHPCIGGRPFSMYAAVIEAFEQVLCSKA